MNTNIIDSKRYISLSIAIIFLGLLVVGGTYAYISITGDITGATYNTGGTCFVIDYSVENEDGTLPISGVLFPSSTPKGGLTGQITMKIDSSCRSEGIGTMYLNVASSTSSVLIGNGYCLNSKTMEEVLTVPVKGSNGNVTYETATSANCSNVNNSSWVQATSTPALKYAIYANDGASPVSSGYVNTTGDIVIYDNFAITQTAITYNIYVWLDGAMSDNSYANKSFSGYIRTTAIQSE